MVNLNNRGLFLINWSKITAKSIKPGCRIREVSVMKAFFDYFRSDIAPREGRQALNAWNGRDKDRCLSWAGSGVSLDSRCSGSNTVKKCILRLRCSMSTENPPGPEPGWMELELGGRPPEILDLFLAGTRPLPQEDIKALCRHPDRPEYLVATTSDSRLLLVDARLQANLEVVHSLKLPAPLISLAVSGSNLLGLEINGRTLNCFHQAGAGAPVPILIQRLNLPVCLKALAEMDSAFAWGLGVDGGIYQISLPPAAFAFQAVRPVKIQARIIGPVCGSLLQRLKRLLSKTRPGILGRGASRRPFCLRPEPFTGLAYDGSRFWSFYPASGKNQTGWLVARDEKGGGLKAYPIHPMVSISSLSFSHGCLLVLDELHQQLHQYFFGDTMEAASPLKPSALYHQGFLSAGGSKTGGMHDLCLLYVGGESQAAVHRYEAGQLRALAGYVSTRGDIQDQFMDGFLMLAQYSPLLNGRSYGSDLEGPPSCREDWQALFAEYFHPRSNLAALEKCAREVRAQIGPNISYKVVLAVPSADSRCLDWDGEGYSLAPDSHRLAVIRWAMNNLLKRWQKAGFHCLTLAGFYYMCEQGAYNDPVLHAFPGMCRKLGLRSFAIPGISSSWLSEFSRAGFDCVALQSSHAFWQPPDRPPRYLLKCAGQIARQSEMGMEVELPYEVLDPGGRQKLLDYLEMARIQGWAGAFKAYFQSYNLIKSLAESEIPECRQLYDHLYLISRSSRPARGRDGEALSGLTELDCQACFEMSSSPLYLRLTIEGQRGIVRITELELKEVRR